VDLILVKVKPNCAIEHDGKAYGSEDLVQLPKQYLGFHNQNVEVAENAVLGSPQVEQFSKTTENAVLGSPQVEQFSKTTENAVLSAEELSEELEDSDTWSFKNS
jgi:hypothetical protein